MFVHRSRNPFNTLAQRTLSALSFFRFLTLIMLPGSVAFVAPSEAAFRARSTPSVLFLVQDRRGAFTTQLDRGYLKELQRTLGLRFGVKSLHLATAKTLQKYDAVVVYQEAGGFREEKRRLQGNPRQFAAMLRNYVQRGGGLFLMPWRIQAPNPMPTLSKTFQFDLPHATLEETDPRKKSSLLRGSIPTPIAWTSNIKPSVVSQGVKQLWYMYGISRGGRQTGPIRLLSKAWKVVARASATARTVPQRSRRRRKAEQERAPVLFAIRQFGKGRVALFNTWYHGTFGQGTKWVFARQLLSKGSQGKPSDAHRLLTNTLRWLTATRYAQRRNQRPKTLVLQNSQSQIRQRYALREVTWTPAKVRQDRQRHLMPQTYRGVIGVRSRYSSGRSTLLQYKQAALRHKFDFLVFLEDYSKLTQRTFRKLRQEARRLSDARVKLIPGYRMRTNTGNYMFVFGETAQWMPSRFVRRDGTLKLQAERSPGQWTFDQRLLSWTLRQAQGRIRQVGFYRFSESSKQGLKVSDLRLYSSLGVDYHRGTQRVESLHQEYIQNSQAGLPPTPLSITDVSSANDLPSLLKKHVPLTHIVGKRLADVTHQLGWSNVYASPHVYVSSGPKILAFQGTRFYRTLGAQQAITGRALHPVHIVVQSTNLLRQMTIYKNGRVFRLIRPRRTTQRWTRTLLLPGNVQTNLILKVEDVRGLSAISSINRSVKDAHGDIVFCGDRVNDCSRNPVLARGSFNLPVHFSPQLLVDEAGFGWDGGPVGNLDLTNTIPWGILSSKRHTRIDTSRYNQTPFLHFSDEGSIGVRSVADEVFARGFHKPRKLPLTPWSGYAPKSKSRVLRREDELRIWKPINDTMPQDGHLFYGGSRMSLGFWRTWSFVFHQNITLNSLYLFGLTAKPKVPLYALVHSYQKGIVPIHVNLSASSKPSVSVAAGGWFALYSTAPGTNSHLFFNMGPHHYRLKLNYGFSPIKLILRNPQHRAGSRLNAKLVSYAFSVRTPIQSSRAMRAYVDYLYRLPAPKMQRGSIQGLRGLVTLQAHQGATAFIYPKAPSSVRDLGLGFRVKGLVPHWSAGFLQRSGYVPTLLRSSQAYSKSATNRYRPLGVDPKGSAWFPLNVAAAQHRIEAGHPYIARYRNRLVMDVAVQVTHLRDKPHQWYIAVNHLGRTGSALTFKLQAQMNLPGAPFQCMKVTLQPYQHLIVHQFGRTSRAVRPCK